MTQIFYLINLLSPTESIQIATLGQKYITNFITTSEEAVSFNFVRTFRLLICKAREIRPTAPLKYKIEYLRIHSVGSYPDSITERSIPSWKWWQIYFYRFPLDEITSIILFLLIQSEESRVLSAC